MINFTRYTKLYFLFSAIVISFGMFTLFSKGFNLSIDFTGGSMTEYSFDKNTSTDAIQKVFDKNKIEVSLGVRQCLKRKSLPYEKI